MQSVLLRRTPPAFELSRHPCPLTRNYREGTPGTRTRKETSRRRRFSPVVSRGAFQETGQSHSGHAVFRFRIVGLAMARVSKKRKLEEIESRVAQKGFIFSSRGIFNSIFALHEKGCVFIMDIRYRGFMKCFEVGKYLWKYFGVRRILKFCRDKCFWKVKIS